MALAPFTLGISVYAVTNFSATAANWERIFDFG
jgi:hypothetical protein